MRWRFCKYKIKKRAKLKPKAVKKSNESDTFIIHLIEFTLSLLYKSKKT